MYIEIRKKQTYTYILEHFKNSGKFPLLDDIGKNAYDGKTLSSERVKQIIRKLEKEGKIKMVKGKIETISNNEEKFETEERFKDVRIKNVKEAKLEMRGNKTFKEMEHITPEEIMNSGTIIKFECNCGHKFLNDFTDFIESKLENNK